MFDLFILYSSPIAYTYIGYESWKSVTLFLLPSTKENNPRFLTAL